MGSWHQAGWMARGSTGRLVADAWNLSRERDDKMGNLNITIEERVVLFADVHDYSKISRALGVNAYSFLQEMYEKLGDIIVEHGGTIVKYLGDALLCAFPADSRASPRYLTSVSSCSTRMSPSFSYISCRKL